jgi:hypothetical protein
MVVAKLPEMVETPIVRLQMQLVAVLLQKVEMALLLLFIQAVRQQQILQIQRYVILKKRYLQIRQPLPAHLLLLNGIMETMHLWIPLQIPIIYIPWEERTMLL